MGEKETANAGAAEKAAPGEPTKDQVTDSPDAERKGHEASMPSVGNIRA